MANFAHLALRSFLSLRASSHDHWRGPQKASRIELRRFAGPMLHAEQLTTPLRIAHLTDQHVGRVTPMRVQQEAVQLTNEQTPDLVCITGDFVCHSQDYLDALEETIASFTAPVITVLGNHDHWSGAKEVMRALRRGGAEVLRNEHTVLQLNGQALQVVGLDDAYTGHADWRKATKGMDPKLPTIGLSHIAEEADPLWSVGVPLVLSGHTHGGQVTFARLHELALGHLVGHRYIHGLYGTRQQVAPFGSVYVGAGIGASVIPVRIGERAQREVALFDLGIAPGMFDEHHETQQAFPGKPVSAKTMARRAKKVAKVNGKTWNLIKFR